MYPKKPFLVAALLLLPFLCRATPFDERYGIGTVHIVPYNFFALDFYSRVDDIAPYEEVNFSKNKEAGGLHFQFSTCGPDTLPAWFVPEYFNTEGKKMRIEMFCLEKQGDWCKVLLNPTTGLTKWVHLGIDVVYYDWNTFFTSISSVQIISGDAKLYSKPSVNAAAEPLMTKFEAGGSQLIQPEKVDGEWMQVKVIRFTYNMEQTSSTEGWIRWHDDAGIFISYDLSLD